MSGDAPRTIEVDPSGAELAAFRRAVRGLFAADSSTSEPQAAQPSVRARGAAAPFLVATPLGLTDRAGLERALAGVGVRPRLVQGIEGWPRVATALYLRGQDDGALRLAYAFERAWEVAFPGASAEVWWLSSMEAHARAAASKRSLRHGLPSLGVRLVLPELTYAGSLHSFHVPDEERIAEEARRVTPVEAAR